MSNAHAAGFEWFKTALLMELLVHLPIFLLGTRALYQGAFACSRGRDMLDLEGRSQDVVSHSDRLFSFVRRSRVTVKHLDTPHRGTLSATQCVAALFGAASKTLTSTQMQQLALLSVAALEMDRSSRIIATFPSPLYPRI